MSNQIKARLLKLLLGYFLVDAVAPFTVLSAGFVLPVPHESATLLPAGDTLI
jgi:hypothetical protein